MQFLYNLLLVYLFVRLFNHSSSVVPARGFGRLLASCGSDREIRPPRKSSYGYTGGTEFRYSKISKRVRYSNQQKKFTRVESENIIILEEICSFVLGASRK